MPERRDLAERFWPKVQITPGCWEWQASRLPTGYGKIGLGGKHGAMIGAHRASWELHHGPIPSGQVVRHRCDNPPCVNPQHLELGTQAENLADMRARGRAPVIDRAGARNGHARLTAEEVRYIRSIPMRPGLNQELAERYGLNWKYISALRNGAGWREIA